MDIPNRVPSSDVLASKLDQLKIDNHWRRTGAVGKVREPTRNPSVDASWRQALPVSVTVREGVDQTTGEVRQR
jgi:hypothetical protein